jgi:hypothetical protein
MPLILKSALVATAACLTIAASTPSQAQDGYYANPAQHYDAYQNPDGTYDSLADLSRDVRGIPCGIECTQDSQARGSHYYATHPHGKYRYTPGW